MSEPGPLNDDRINGAINLPGVHADIVAARGQYVSIYGWSGDHTGRTRDALRALRAYGGKVFVHDPGELDSPDSTSRHYWNKMLAEGLVDELEMDDGRKYAQTDASSTLEHITNVLISARKLDQGESAARLTLDYSLDQCLHAIAMRTGGGAASNLYIVPFLNTQDWIHLEAPRQVWERLFESGMIDPNGLVPFSRASTVLMSTEPIGDAPVLPLEVAVHNANPSAFQALLNSGAELAAVPSRDWSGCHQWSWSQPGPIGDVMSFIWARASMRGVAPVLASQAAEAIMTRAMSPVADANSKAGPRRASRAL